MTTQTSAYTFLVRYLLPKAVFIYEATFYLRIWTLHKPRAFVGLEKTLQMFTSFTHCHSRKYTSNYSLLGRQSRRNPTEQAQKWLWLQLTVDMRWDFTLFQTGGTRGELSYLAPLGSENISAPYFKQGFFRGGVSPPRLSETPRLPVPRQK